MGQKYFDLIDDIVYIFGAMTIELNVMLNCGTASSTIRADKYGQLFLLVRDGFIELLQSVGAIASEDDEYDAEFTKSLYNLVANVEERVRTTVLKQKCPESIYAKTYSNHLYDKRVSVELRYEAKPDSKITITITE